jgi:hypothetical protein
MAAAETVMDARILIALVIGLGAVAFGGFYVALKPAREFVAPAALPTQIAGANDTVSPAAAPAGGLSVAPQSAPKAATPESIEAEIAKSEQADLQALLKQHFPDDYRELIEVAVRRSNEGAPDRVLGEEVFNRFQQVMAAKLKFAVGAGMAAIDKLAANEVKLFDALGSEGSGYCLKVLGKDDSPSTAPIPEPIRRLMRLGSLYRFEAIVDGMPRMQVNEPLKPDEIAAFEASLNRDGLNFDEIRTGVFLSKEGEAQGKPCQMVAKLYRAIARLDEGTRRKLYAGMFFLGRDK